MVDINCDIETEYLFAKLLYRINFIDKKKYLNLIKQKNYNCFINIMKISKIYLYKSIKKRIQYNDNSIIIKPILEQFYFISIKIEHIINSYKKCSQIIKNKVFYSDTKNKIISNTQILKESINIINNQINLSTQISRLLIYSSNSLEKINQININLARSINHVDIDLKDNFDSNPFKSKIKKFLLVLMNLIFIYCIIILFN
jgi:hypothetical protein